MEEYGKRYLQLRSEVDEQCRQAGRAPEDVLLLAVSKTVDAPAVRSVCEAGCADFGENRPDDLMAKQEVYPQLNWHFIGNLQSRRIPDVVARACLIHSVYKPDHLPKINRAAQAAGIVQDILLEINSGEEAKGGLPPAQAAAFLEAAAACPHVRVKGLMTMAPLGDRHAARSCFEKLRLLRDSLQEQMRTDSIDLGELSMGMSGDWPEAILEGATIIRVGTAVFSSDFV